MKCEYCGNELDVNSIKCAKCGAPVPNKNNEILSEKINLKDAKTNNIINDSNKKKGKKIFIPIIVSIIVLAIVAVIIWLLVFNKDKDDEKMSISEIKNEIKSAANKMKSLDNYTMDLSINVDMSYNGTKGSLDIAGTVKVDEKNKVYSVNASVFDQQIEMYGQYDETNVTIYQYDSYNDKWTKDVSEFDMESSEIISNLILDSTEISKVDSDIKGLTKYKVTMDTKKLSELTNSTGLDDTYNLDTKIPGEVNVYVYINSDNYVEKIYIDLLEMIDDMELFTDEYVFNDLSVTITFSKFNSTGNLVIPDEVVNNAVSADELLNYDISYNEEDIMFDIVISSATYCQENTIDFSNYNGELDEYLELDQYDISSIAEGIIAVDKDCDVVVQKDFVINGKTCTYDDENYESCQ